MPIKLWWEHLKGRNNLEEMGIDGRVRQDIYFICEVAVSPRTRVTNLWHAGSSLWHAASTAVPICFIPFDRPVSILWCVCVYTHTHTHMSDCVEIVCEILLLPNNTASESFLRTSRAVLHPPKKRRWSNVSQILSGQGVDPTSLLRRSEGVWWLCSVTFIDFSW
jgi:hypothetical protein